MANCIDVVRSYYIALDQRDVEKAGRYLSDDFRQYGSASESMGKHETLDVKRLLLAAMPDLKHALSNISEDGSVVTLTVQAGGRHTQPLDLSHMGMGIEKGVIPSSGRTIIFLPDDMKYTVLNGKIVSEQIVTPPTLYNGVNGFLHAFGIEGIG
jgi:hypothetical protein